MLRDIMIILLVGAGALLGGQVNPFIMSYEQRLDGGVQELVTQLIAFRNNATENRMSLKQYLDELDANNAPIVRGTANAVRRLVNRVAYLEPHQQRLRAAKTSWQKLWIITRDGDPTMVMDTLKQQRLSLTLDMTYSPIGAGLGYVLCVFGWLLTRRWRGQRVQRLTIRKYGN